jgi:hypothetical protein
VIDPYKSDRFVRFHAFQSISVARIGPEPGPCACECNRWSAAGEPDTDLGFLRGARRRKQFSDTGRLQSRRFAHGPQVAAQCALMLCITHSSEGYGL